MAKIAAFSRVFENMCVAIPMGAMMVLLAIAAFGFEGAEARGVVVLHEKPTYIQPSTGKRFKKVVILRRGAAHGSSGHAPAKLMRDIFSGSFRADCDLQVIGTTSDGNMISEADFNLLLKAFFLAETGTPAAEITKEKIEAWFGLPDGAAENLITLLTKEDVAPTRRAGFEFRSTSALKILADLTAAADRIQAWAAPPATTVSATTAELGPGTGENSSEVTPPMDEGMGSEKPPSPGDTMDGTEASSPTGATPSPDTAANPDKPGSGEDAGKPQGAAGPGAGGAGTGGAPSGGKPGAAGGMGGGPGGSKPGTPGTMGGTPAAPGAMMGGADKGKPGAGKGMMGTAAGSPAATGTGGAAGSAAAMGMNPAMMQMISGKKGKKTGKGAKNGVSMNPWVIGIYPWQMGGSGGKGKDKKCCPPKVVCCPQPAGGKKPKGGKKCPPKRGGKGRGAKNC